MIREGMCNIEKMGATCAISECKKTTAVVTQSGILAWHAHTLGPNPFCQNPMLIFLDLYDIIKYLSGIPYARHYNPRFLLFLPYFSFSLRFILQTIYVLKRQFFIFLSLKSVVYIRERFLIKSGL